MELLPRPIDRAHARDASDDVKLAILLVEGAKMCLARARSLSGAADTLIGDAGLSDAVSETVGTLRKVRLELEEASTVPERRPQGPVDPSVFRCLS
jgi:hypothetical protein